MQMRLIQNETLGMDLAPNVVLNKNYRLVYVVFLSTKEILNLSYKSAPGLVFFLKLLQLTKHFNSFLKEVFFILLNALDFLCSGHA